MKIGVAKEIKSDEYRVALTPAGARELVQRGHDVIVEAGAGEGSAFTDDAYEAAGARIAGVEGVWGDSELLLKVKEPIQPEYERLRVRVMRAMTRILNENSEGRRRFCVQWMRAQWKFTQMVSLGFTQVGVEHDL